MYVNGTKMELSIRQKGDEKMQEKLIIMMKKNNITNRELASKIGISEKQMGLKLKGETDFKCSEMLKISDIFHKTMDEIFLPSMYVNGTQKTN